MERIKLLRYMNVATLVSVATFNTFDCISHGRSVVWYFAFVVPFILMALIFAIVKTYKINAIFYAVCGLVITATGSMGNFSGAIFLVFSIYIFNTPITNYILTSSCAAVIVARYLFAGYSIPDTVNMFAAHAFTFGVYFVLIHPKPAEKPVVLPIDDDTIEIVQLLKRSRKPKEIADIMNLSIDQVRYRIRKARERYDCKDDLELYGKLQNAGIISKNIDNTA